MLLRAVRGVEVSGEAFIAAMGELHG
jgi:hypothetical protein